MNSPTISTRLSRLMNALVVKWCRFLSVLEPFNRILLWGAKLALLAYLAFCVLPVLKGTVDTLSVVDADTEILRFKVSSPSYEMIPLDVAQRVQMAGGTGGEDIRECVSGFFKPEKGATVLLVKQTSNRLSVKISPPSGSNSTGTLSQQRRSPLGNVEMVDTPVSGIVLFVLSADSDSVCGDTARNIRIPVSGIVTLGDEFGPYSHYDSSKPTMLSGEVRMFGRASPIFPFTISMFKDIGSGQSLYPAGTFILPAGARLRECAEKTDWWGYADAYLENDAKMAGMATHLTTNVGTFALITSGGQHIKSHSSTQQCPGSDKTWGNNEDLIEIGLLSRMSGDPYLLFVWLAVPFLFVVIQTLAALLAIPLRDKQDEG